MFGHAYKDDMKILAMNSTAKRFSERFCATLYRKCALNALVTYLLLVQ